MFLMLACDGSCSKFFFSFFFYEHTAQTSLPAMPYSNVRFETLLK